MPGRPIRPFTVLPSLPERLQSLNRVAYNLWWCWHADAVALFRRIDPDLFEALDHSPVRLLTSTPQARFEELAADEGFLAELDRVTNHLKDYMSATTYFQKTYPNEASAKIAYFSMEFGIHESVPVYSGGLGVLAGDHLKSSSDLGLPLCGVSFMFREGYFRQYLNNDGWQQERYPENDFFNLPLIAELDDAGKPVMVSAPLPGREVKLRIWRLQVGRVPLYLLDANIPENDPRDRNITSQLYGGDRDNRIQQEILLGIGGLRALRAIGVQPTVCHMNEGHAAFVTLERIRQMMGEQGLPFATAAEAVKAGTCFTTHTPVPAGNDAFPAQMIESYLGDYLSQLGIDRPTLYKLGRQHPENEAEPFGMTVLALKLANTSNGVSQLHGVVSRKMWNDIWRNLPSEEVPIGSITNGVHTQSWISPEMEELFDRYLDVKWDTRPTDFAVWKSIDKVPDTELWRTHSRCRAKLVNFARARLKAQLERRGAPPHELRQAEEVLDPDALTIGFARRFATYKRGDLIFRDAPRLQRILADTSRPVQFIFAGKAHPQDNGGKELIARVVREARRPEFRHNVVFLEDYDMNIARHMIHGVDVWLNNPRRPLEASGTSGMKVVMNGGLNCSILDGWWVEGYDTHNGWAIGSGEEYTDLNYQDDVESRQLYDLLERDIIPTFYDRDNSEHMPRDWLRRMKHSIASLTGVFNTNRMVEDYLKKCYLPSHHRFMTLSQNQAVEAGKLAEWRKTLMDAWPKVTIERVSAPPPEALLKVGAEFPVEVEVNLGPLAASDVTVEVCHGLLDSRGEIANPTTTPLTATGPATASPVTFAGSMRCQSSGQFGFTVRVLPQHPHLPTSFEPAVVTWG